MKKRHLTVLAVLLALAVWQGTASDGPLSMAGSLVSIVTGSPSPAAEATSQNPASTPSTGEGAAGSGAIVAGTASAQAASATPPGEPYPLTRSLSGNQTIQFEGRAQRLLGTREITDAHGRQTLLLVRDERSGAISYWQSGLRLAVKPGVDREAVLREHPALRRQFLNPDYADVVVDAAALAAAYRSLAADPRVAGVLLLPLRQRDKPR